MARSDLADLTAFVAIADNLSFRAAAARLGVTPSALSHTMRQLEERLGVRLLHRTTRSVSPTDVITRTTEVQIIALILTFKFRCAGDATFVGIPLPLPTWDRIDLADFCATQRMRKI